MSEIPPENIRTIKLSFDCLDYLFRMEIRLSQLLIYVFISTVEDEVFVLYCVTNKLSCALHRYEK
jgi:hypothetical protein